MQPGSLHDSLGWKWALTEKDTTRQALWPALCQVCCFGAFEFSAFLRQPRTLRVRGVDSYL